MFGDKFIFHDVHRCSFQVIYNVIGIFLPSHFSPANHEPKLLFKQLTLCGITITLGYRFIFMVKYIGYCFFDRTSR
ncbi:hypothetical protein A9Q74_06475 [Colwellia sp. 39_35_sub15_T18]|nr:hypothetical protein A9Q74_06475 [Colwellia sp. 39_35_sub15_T18]